MFVKSRTFWDKTSKSYTKAGTYQDPTLVGVSLYSPKQLSFGVSMNHPDWGSWYNTYFCRGTIPPCRIVG